MEKQKGVFGISLWPKQMICWAYIFYFIAYLMLKNNLIALKGFLKLAIKNDSLGNLANRFVK